MFRRLEAIGTLLILFSLIFDSECLVVPFVVIMAGAVMVLIGRRTQMDFYEEFDDCNYDPMDELDWEGCEDEYSENHCYASEW